MLSAQQECEQVVGRGVVADQLRRDSFGFQEHVDGGSVVALLGVGTGQVEADLASAARQACRKVLEVEPFAALHRSASVTESHGRRDAVNADVGRAECGPVVIAILAKMIGDALGLVEGPVCGGTIELGRCGERIGQVQAAHDR